MEKLYPLPGILNCYIDYLTLFLIDTDSLIADCKYFTPNFLSLKYW